MTTGKGTHRRHRASRWRAFRRAFDDPVFQKFVEFLAVIAFAAAGYVTSPKDSEGPQLQLVIALLWALFGFMALEFLFRYTRTRHDRLVTQLAVQDEQIKSVVESVLQSAEHFEDHISQHPALRPVLERHRDRHLANLELFFAQYGALDLDVDEQEEQRFTVDLVDVAKEKIRAISVKEEQFWTSDMDGSLYLGAQRQWLESDKKRKIFRIFVTDTLHDPSLDRTAQARASQPAKSNADAEPPAKRMWVDTRTQEDRDTLIRVLEIHWAIAENALKDLRTPEDGSRYEIYVVPNNVWIWHRSENTDLVIYDTAHVKRGPLTDTETRKALFRSSDAARMTAENEFENLKASSVLASQYFKKEFEAFQNKRGAIGSSNRGRKSKR